MEMEFVNMTICCSEFRRLVAETKITRDDIMVYFKFRNHFYGCIDCREGFKSDHFVFGHDYDEDDDPDIAPVTEQLFISRTGEQWLELSMVLESAKPSPETTQMYPERCVDIKALFGYVIETDKGEILFIIVCPFSQLKLDPFGQSSERKPEDVLASLPKDEKVLAYAFLNAMLMAYSDFIDVTQASRYVM